MVFRPFPVLLLCALLLPALSGCFPLAAGGIVAGALAVDDRRTLATQAEDRTIQLKAESRIADAFRGRANVNVTAYNRRVLLTGEVPDANARAEAARIAGAVENVVSVANELQVGGVSSMTSRSNDSILTGKVKGNMVDDPQVQANTIKVTTEASVVFLMGLVTREEGDRAAAAAARTSGVKQVVKVFEYIPAPPRAAEKK